MTFKYDRQFAACLRAEEHCKLHLPLYPPAVNCRLSRPISDRQIEQKSSIPNSFWFSSIKPHKLMVKTKIPFQNSRLLLGIDWEELQIIINVVCCFLRRLIIKWNIWFTPFTRDFLRRNNSPRSVQNLQIDQYTLNRTIFSVSKSEPICKSQGLNVFKKKKMGPKNRKNSRVSLHFVVVFLRFWYFFPKLIAFNGWNDLRVSNNCFYHRLLSA